MNEDADTEHIDETDGNNEVPDEIPRYEGLDHAAGTGIAPYARLPVEGLALLIGEHTPKGEDVDEGALEQRNDM